MAACPHTIAESAPIVVQPSWLHSLESGEGSAFSAGRDACTTILPSALHNGPWAAEVASPELDSSARIAAKVGQVSTRKLCIRSTPASKLTNFTPRPVIWPRPSVAWRTTSPEPRTGAEPLGRNSSKRTLASTG